MDKKVVVPEDVHITTTDELAAMLATLPGLPVFFAASASGVPKCVLSVYEDDVKQVWIDIGSVKGD